MGMSGDFETAIAMGATHVRVGTALFGNRGYNEPMLKILERRARCFSPAYRHVIGWTKTRSAASDQNCGPNLNKGDIHEPAPDFPGR